MPPPPVTDAALPLPPGGDERGAPRASWLRQLFAFMGPAWLVAVGYMDPGNWATDLAGGSAFAYSLLWVVLLSSLMAIVLQILSARLGLVSGLDLAQSCRRHFSPWSCRLQWLAAEIAICATDLAEVIGTAIALNLLFGLPLLWGVALTVVDVLLVLWLQQGGRGLLESVILALLTVVFICVGINMFLAGPDWGGVAGGLVPDGELLRQPDMLYLAMGIIGATVMPHNLYLHSAHVRREPGVDLPHTLRLTAVGVGLALSLAFFVNAALLITAAAVFHDQGYTQVAEIQEAHSLLSPIVGSALASTLFAVALLAAGQSSTMTATLAGQVVMEGYVNLRLPIWARRLLTRALAVVPALFICAAYGESGLARLLVFSQVILSLQLPFAVVPLIWFTSRPQTMGPHANPLWLKLLAGLIAALIIALNLVLLSFLWAGG